jgi:membrane-associated phospholipid phosphatase
MRAGRRSKSIAAALLFATLCPRTSSAQRPTSEQRDLRNFGGDVWAMWTSPARTQRRDLVPIAAAVGGFAAVSLVDSIVQSWIFDQDKAFPMRLFGPIREGADLPFYELGSGQMLLPISAALYTAGRLSRSTNLRDAGLGCAAGHLSSLGLREVAYRSVSRPRPSVSAKALRVSFPGSRDWFEHSFFSGHIANSMACASFLGHRYSLGALEPLPYAYATAIGVGRLADGAHWLSDTMIGAAVGFALGKAIAHRQLGRRDRGRPVPLEEIGTSTRIPVYRVAFDF